jgi:hypothetical protein
MEFKILRDAFENIEPIVIGDKSYSPVFHYGSRLDMIKFLRYKYDEDVPYYPLIWLETPFGLTGNQFGQGDMNFILATLSDGNLSNLERTDVTFATTLNPLLHEVLQAIKFASSVDIVSEDTKEVKKFFNYDTDSSHVGTEVWDAILLKCTLRFNFNC